MNNLIDIQLQIEKLQKQAAGIRMRELDKTIQDILAQMQAFSITTKDLQSYKPSAKGKKYAGSAKRNNAAAAVSTLKTVAPKFRGNNGEIWSGRGLTPRWLATLLEQGRKKEEFAINKEPSA